MFRVVDVPPSPADSASTKQISWLDSWLATGGRRNLGGANIARPIVRIVPVLGGLVERSPSNAAVGWVCRGSGAGVVDGGARAVGVIDDDGAPAAGFA